MGKLVSGLLLALQLHADPSVTFEQTPASVVGGDGRGRVKRDEADVAMAVAKEFSTLRKTFQCHAVLPSASALLGPSKVALGS